MNGQHITVYRTAGIGDRAVQARNEPFELEHQVRIIFRRKRAPRERRVDMYDLKRQVGFLQRAFRVEQHAAPDRLGKRGMDVHNPLL